MTKLLIGLLTLFAAMIIGGVTLFSQAAKPYYQVEAETTQYVKDHANIIQVNDFYWYNGADETYFSVSGYNEDTNRVMVIVRQSDGAIMTYDFDETISEYDAYHQFNDQYQPQEILNMSIGLNEINAPMWEITYKDDSGQMGYYYMHLLTGEELGSTTNLSSK